MAEIRNLWGKYNTAQPIEKIREARALMDEYRVRTSILSTGFFKVPIPAENSPALDEQWKLLDGAFERATIMGVKKLRTFAFTYKTGEKPEASAYPRIYELVREAARRAHARGFQLAVENVGQSYVWTGAEAGRLLAAVKEDALGLTWDPNNAGEAGEHAFPEGYKQLDPARIFHVHLRDYRHNKDGKVEWCAVGEGEMDNLGQIRALLKERQGHVHAGDSLARSERKDLFEREESRRCSTSSRKCDLYGHTKPKSIDGCAGLVLGGAVRPEISELPEPPTGDGPGFKNHLRRQYVSRVEGDPKYWRAEQRAPRRRDHARDGDQEQHLHHLAWRLPGRTSS